MIPLATLVQLTSSMGLKCWFYYLGIDISPYYQNQDKGHGSLRSLGLHGVGYL